MGKSLGMICSLKFKSKYQNVKVCASPWPLYHSQTVATFLVSVWFVGWATCCVIVTVHYLCISCSCCDREVTPLHKENSF